jgi:hypothetical protein
MKMIKKTFEKPILSIKALNVDEEIIASVKVDPDTGYAGGFYETALFKRDESGNITGESGTHVDGCFEKLTNGPAIDLTNIHNNMEFNTWIILHIFGGKEHTYDYSEYEIGIYNDCCHF